MNHSFPKQDGTELHIQAIQYTGIFSPISSITPIIFHAGMTRLVGFTQIANSKIGTHCVHVACHLKPYDALALILQSISDNFDHKCSEVQKFIMRFTNQFVNCLYTN